MEFKIEEPDKKIRQEIKANWDRVAKPLDGLGEFEGLLARIGAILGSPEIDIAKKAVIVMCADKGVVAEGISQSGQEITAAVTENLGKRNTSVCKMAQTVGAEIFPVDIGVNTDRIFPGVISRKVKKGTNDFLLKPAMSEREAMQAVRVGMELVKECKEAGYTLLGTGEMGIGNTTTTSAVLSVMLDIKPESVTGRGAGLSDTGLANKINVIKDAISLNKPDRNDVLDVLARVGGFDIAGMAGLFIGGAYYKVPVIIDGIISSAAALAAVQLAPLCRDYMIASHVSAEPAAQAVMEKLELKPLLNIGMALGEGTGAVSIMPIIDMALAMYYDMPTFAEFGMQEYKKL